MPFKLSHAAALPGIRTDGTGRGPLVPSALVAGALAPDMTYYADSVVPAALRQGGLTHSPVGVLTVDVLIAAALGAATHVFRDSFTHMDRWGARWITVLDERVLGVPLYRRLQYGGSVLALVVIAVFLARAWRRLPGTPAPEGERAPLRLSARGRTGVVALPAAAAVAGAVHRCARRTATTPEAVPWDGCVPTALFGAGAGLALAPAVYAAAARTAGRARRVREPVSG